MKIFKRKIYKRLLEFREAQGEYALLIEGARRIGKSTIVREFAKNEYSSYIFIDFTDCPSEVIGLFDDMSDLDFFFLRLQAVYRVGLIQRKSLIVFDEVQFAPKARQAIKKLVADGRYDYIETGSLISIKKNVENILIPSEERSVEMYPMDYEEFQWALGLDPLTSLRHQLIDDSKPLGESVNRSLMRDFRLYVIVGGMPQAVVKYIETNNLFEVDKTKRQILSMYDKDFKKIDTSGRISMLFDSIPAQLVNNASRFQPHSAAESSSEGMKVLISELIESKTVNICYRVTDPGSMMGCYYDPGCFKLFLCDTGLFVTLAFKNSDFTDNIIYEKMLNDKLDANLGYVYENVVAQMLVASGKRLFYYTFKNETGTGMYEIDFIVTEKHKVDPIEVKSSSNLRHASLDAFCAKYSSRIRQPYIISPKDQRKDGHVINLPFYLFPALLDKI